MLRIGSGLVFVLAWALLLLDVDPVPTWFYVFVWYPTLLIADDLAARALGTRPFVRRPALALSLLGWSVPIWLLFEAANFRLRNWYYVMLPAGIAERWAGIAISFATVVPAVLLAERALRAAGVGATLRTTPVRIRPWDLRIAVCIGIGAAVASLGWPTLWFPLIWGAAWCLVDPWLYRRRPEWSLLGDLARGEWGRIARLLTGGLAIGLLWEGYNYWARGKWIYTVPGLESIKLFEMPPFGFLGFPVFALEAWTLYHALCAVGVAVAPDAPTRLPRRRTTWAALVGVAASVAVLWGMESRTISSTVPSVRAIGQLVDVAPDALDRIAGRSPWALALLDSATLDTRFGLAAPDARDLGAVTTLVLHRGLGVAHARALLAAGIGTVCDLARADPDALLTSIRGRAPAAHRPTPAEVRVWVRSAARRCPSDGIR